MQMKRTLNIILSILAIFLISIGFYGFIRGNIIASNLTENQKIIGELSLGGIRGIVVDNDGNIYCGIQAYSRVQVYDRNGNYLYRIVVDGGGGAFKMQLIDNQLNIATTRNEMHYIYDNTGRQIQAEKKRGFYIKFSSENSSKFIDNENNKYIIRNQFLIFPHVVKKEPNGQSYTLINCSFKNWMLMYPLPSWAFGFSGIMIIIYRRRITGNVRCQAV